jgi:predicted dehydrogenase
MPRTAPDLPYRPPAHDFEPTIALVGCGGITEHHLGAYREAGYEVVALCDLEVERARERREAFYPDAAVYADHEAVLAREDVDVVDVATHPEARVPILEETIETGKHVLSQKPFVVDLSDGERLIDRAEEQDVKLAVNQNGRWAPHWSYLREAVAAGAVGDPLGVHLDVGWDHDWIRDTPFEEIPHAILYDFAIHWFDFVATVLDGPERIYASTARSPAQTSEPPLLAQAAIEYGEAQASLAFDGNVEHGQRDRTVVAGTGGTVESEGPGLNDQRVTVHDDAGSASPDLEGQWFDAGFRGSMAELCAAVGADREPRNSGEDNLASLELCFAAVASAEDGQPKEPGTVRKLPGGTV